MENNIKEWIDSILSENNPEESIKTWNKALNFFGGYSSEILLIQKHTREKLFEDIRLILSKKGNLK